VIEMLTETSTPQEFYDGLTGREIEILKMLACGMPTAQDS
jgi:DNA-binding NarL/FixJ family response regulator